MPSWLLKVSPVAAYDGVQMEGKVLGDQVIQFSQHHLLNNPISLTDWNGLLYHKLNSFVYWGLFLGCLFCSIYLGKSHMITLLYRPTMWVKDRTLIRNNNTLHFDSACTRHRSKCFRYINSFHLQNNSMNRSCYYLCFADGKWDTEKLSDWHQIPQPESRGAEIWD